MQVKNLIEQLKELPQDYSIELSKILSVNDENAYEITLDFPIIGVATNDETKECNLVVDHHETVAHYAKSLKKLV